MIMNGRGVGGFPFTPSQWQELERQALIFKYMLSGVPIPPHLLFTVRSSSSLGDPTEPSSHFGWRCFDMGRKIDPEPGRCRRTDGKKWRCSKEAFQDSKYCDKHMHRGKNRSRKPVEQQPVIISTTSPFSKLDSASPYHRHSNIIQAGSSINPDDSWQLTPLTVSSRNSKQTAHHPYLQLQDSTSSSKPGQGHHHMKYESTKRDDNQQHPTVYRFMDEGPPEKKDSSSWLNLDDKSSTTQLPISIPAATSRPHVFPIFNNSRP